ncbi:MAG: hypothetical protein U5L96_21585 [Owenweeksia sp.]|nr:hypothetical protein [Owenweeksia sp.]
MYVLLMDGKYSENGQGTSVLGIAYRSTSFVVFQKTVKDNTGGIAGPSEELGNQYYF